MSSKIEQLRAWLTTTNQFFESINLKKEQRRLSYADYQQFKKELEAQETLYTHLKSQHEDSVKHDSLWKDIDTNWQRVETQLVSGLWNTSPKVQSVVILKNPLNFEKLYF